MPQCACLPVTPYVVEFYTRSYPSLSTNVKLALLSAAHAVFASQPAATQSFYTHLLRLSTAGEEPIILRDRACFQLRSMSCLDADDAEQLET